MAWTASERKRAGEAKSADQRPRRGAARAAATAAAGEPSVRAGLTLALAAVALTALALLATAALAGERVGGGAGQGHDLIVRLPAGVEVKSAVVVAPLMKLDTPGKAQGNVVTFANVLPDTDYNARIALSDGTVLQGVNLGWYDEEPANKDAGDLDKDDREQIRAIVQDVKSFYNKRDILMLRGDHDRAVALLRLVRDKAFVNDKGGEVIWRIELWYFKNQNGGWEAVSQQNKVLRRERFASAAAREAEERPIRWTPALGGLRVPASQPSATATVEKIEPAPAAAGHKS